MSIHANSTNDEVHTPIRWLYANSTARLAATYLDFTALDVRKFAVQLSDNSVWMLADIGSGSSSPVWVALGGAVSISAVAGLGTGIATALAVDVGTDGAPVIKGGALGTPLTGDLANCVRPIKVITSNYTAVIGDYTLLVDATAGPVAITLPHDNMGFDAVDGMVLIVKKIDASINAVTADTLSFGQVDGATLTLLTQWQSAVLHFLTNQYYVLAVK